MWNLTAILKNLLDILVSYHNVPARNSSANALIRDVLGNKTDGHSGNSVISLLKTLIEHIHKPSIVYPNRASGINVIDGGAGWTPGVITQIIPANTISKDYDIHFVMIEDTTAVDSYQIDFYYGNSNIFAGSCVFVRSAQQDSNVLVPVQGTGDGVPISANSRLSGILTSNGGGRTASVKLFYHVY